MIYKKVCFLFILLYFVVVVGDIGWRKELELNAAEHGDDKKKWCIFIFIQKGKGRKRGLSYSFMCWE